MTSRRPRSARTLAGMALLFVAVLATGEPVLAQTKSSTWQTWYAGGPGLAIDCAASRASISDTSVPPSFVEVSASTLLTRGVYCPTFDPGPYGRARARVTVAKIGKGVCTPFTNWLYSSSNTALVTQGYATNVVASCGHGAFYAYGDHRAFRNGGWRANTSTGPVISK